MYSKDRKGSVIVIAVTGGIAAYRTCELVRSLVKRGEQVQVIMTENALNFIGKATFEGLTDRPVYAGKWDEGMIHIHLKNQARVFAVVPATANSIGKFAGGIGDDIVSTTYLAMTNVCPILIAPSMNPAMYESQAVQRNLSFLQESKVHIIDPSEGLAVCGDEGKGKMAPVEQIEEQIIALARQVKV